MTSGRHAIVVGGGITGTLVALQLARAGWQVTVLEGAYVGAGSSSRTAAGIRQQFSTPGTVKGMRYAVRWYKELGDHLATPAIVQNGYLFLLDDEGAWADAQQRVRMQQEAGLAEVEALDQSELLARFPFVNPALVGATWCPTDGFLHPQVIYGEGARLAAETGAVVLQRAEVTGARHENGRLAALITPKGEFSGDLYLDCTNAWTRQLSAILGAEELPVDPLKRYLWFVQRDGPMTAEQLTAMPMCISPQGGYCRPENPNSLLMGKKHPALAELGFDYEDQDLIEPAFNHKSGFDSIPYELWAEMAEVIPDLGEFGGITATTSGFYGSSPDHNPFLGYDRQIPNLVRLVGFSGHGAMFGPFSALVAEALAEAGKDIPEVVLDDGDRVSMEPFHIGRSFDHSEAMVI